MQSKELIMRVTELAEQICREQGVRLWDVLFEKEGQGHMLTVFIDRDEGIFIEDCENVSRALDGPLDAPAFDSLPSYTLCVSSPGLERRLRTKDHFLWGVGKVVDASLYTAKNGQKTVTGTLLSYAPDGAIALESEGGPLTLSPGEYSRVSIHFDF